jgi:site-specific recombinase XerC
MPHVHRKRQTAGTAGPLEISTVKEAFDAYLTEERGVTVASKDSYWFIARRFLAECGCARRALDPAILGPKHVTEYLVRHAAKVSTKTLQTMGSGLRSFLRFLFRRGWTPTDLSTSVLTPRSWRHAALPRYLAVTFAESLPIPRPK